MKTFMFVAKSTNIVVTISAENKEDALQEIAEYFNENGVEDLILDTEYEDE